MRDHADVGTKDDHHRLVIWEAGRNKQTQDGIGAADNCVSCARKEGMERKENDKGIERV